MRSIEVIWGQIKTITKSDEIISQIQDLDLSFSKTYFRGHFMSPEVKVMLSKG